MEFDLSPVIANWRFLAGGLVVTAQIAVITIVGSTVLGAAVGIMRVYGAPILTVPLAFYVDSMRAIPVLAVLLWNYFGLPIAFGITFSPFAIACISLIIHVGAYVSEIVRAGLLSVRPGQMRAALALGMSRWQAIRKIIIPQAAIRMLPAYGSVLSIAIKDTAITTVIAVPDYMHRSETVSSQSMQPFEIFTLALIVYFCVLFPTTRLVDIVYRRISYRGRS
jgi:polar amino acid transport system permease protein